MLNRFMGLVLTVLAFFVFSTVALAQNAAPPSLTKPQVAASAPDLSGIWTRLRDKGATARGYPAILIDFAQPAELPMTPWAAAKYKITARCTTATIQTPY